MVHVASVWVPFTSESKEAIAAYPEIQKELRLALQAVGRKLGMYVRRRLKVKQQGETPARSFCATWAKWPRPSAISTTSTAAQLYEQLLSVAKKRTADADMKLDDRGRPVEEAELAADAAVLIVDPLEAAAAINQAPVPPPADATAE